MPTKILLLSMMIANALLCTEKTLTPAQQEVYKKQYEAYHVGEGIDNIDRIIKRLDGLERQQTEANECIIL
jgi:thymidylate synthase